MCFSKSSRLNPAINADAHPLKFLTPTADLSGCVRIKLMNSSHRSLN